MYIYVYCLYIPVDKQAVFYNDLQNNNNNITLRFFTVNELRLQRKQPIRV